VTAYFESRRARGFAVALTLFWARCYSIGLSSRVRQRRRLELESDLWEHSSDRIEAGASPALVNVEVLGRLLRGIPSDIAWRFQAEGLNLNINIPIERIVGILLLFMIVPFTAGAAIAGYDTSRSSWHSEIQRFSEMSETARTGTQVLHGVIGLGLVAAAGLILGGLAPRSPRLITTASAFLGVAGLIMVVNSAFYGMQSDTASEWARTRDAATMETARTYARAVEGLAHLNLVATVSGVCLLAIAAHRLAIVPRPMAWLAAASVGALSLTVVSSIADIGGLAWAGFGLTWLFAGLWLIISGVYLVLGGAKPKGELGLPAAAVQA